MNNKNCQWESGALGRDEAFVKVADESEEQALDMALNMQTISIRLPKRMIEAYKFIASFHGVGYQPLMRDILQRWVKDGLKEVVATQSGKSQEAAERLSEIQSRKVA